MYKMGTPRPILDFGSSSIIIIIIIINGNYTQHIRPP